MKLTIYKDERWPDYGLTDDSYLGEEVELSSELEKRYRAAEEEYGAVQEELAKLYKASVKARRHD